MCGDRGERVEDELDSVKYLAEGFKQGWQNETENWFQRWGDA